MCAAHEGHSILGLLERSHGPSEAPFVLRVSVRAPSRDFNEKSRCARAIWIYDLQLVILIIVPIILRGASSHG